MASDSKVDSGFGELYTRYEPFMDYEEILKTSP